MRTRQTLTAIFITLSLGIVGGAFAPARADKAPPKSSLPGQQGTVQIQTFTPASPGPVCASGFTYNAPTPSHGAQCVGAPYACPTGGQWLTPGTPQSGCCPSGANPTSVSGKAVCVNARTDKAVAVVAPMCLAGQKLYSDAAPLPYLCVGPARCAAPLVLVTATGQCVAPSAK